MDPALILRQILQLLLLSGLGLLIFVGYRSVRRRSDVLGWILAFGIIGRVAVGLLLFWISYLELPIGQSLQAGGGFWLVAVDAQRYYLGALAAIEEGLWTFEYSTWPSPFFVRILALWMFLVGANPVSGLFLNVCVYAAASVLLVRLYAPVGDRRQDLPAVVALAGFTFSPAIFIHGTQPLKDDLVSGCLVLICVGLLALLRMVVYGGRGLGPAALVVASAAVLGASYMLAGIRWYLPIIVCGAAMTALALFLIRGRTTTLPRYLLGSAALVVAIWWSAGGMSNFASVFLFAADGRSPAITWRSLADIPGTVVAMTRLARAGFLVTEGDTNIATPVRPGGTHEGGALTGTRPATLGTVAPGRRDMWEPSGKVVPLSDVELAAVRAIPRTPVEHVLAAARGLVVMFVPISVLKAVSFVDFRGGRGFLPIADLDTVFQDAVILALLWLVWQRRAAIGTRLPFVAFCLVLAGATAVLLGYVVTNYGTLFRMRPMVLVPLCVLAVALSAPRGRTGVREASRETPATVHA